MKKRTAAEFATVLSYLMSMIRLHIDHVSARTANMFAGKKSGRGFRVVVTNRTSDYKIAHFHPKQLSLPKRCFPDQESKSTRFSLSALRMLCLLVTSSPNPFERKLRFRLRTLRRWVQGLGGFFALKRLSHASVFSKFDSVFSEFCSEICAAFRRLRRHCSMKFEMLIISLCESF